MLIKKIFQASSVMLLSCGIAFSAQARDFRLGLITPPSHQWTQAATAFAEEIHEKSDGKHSIAIFPAQQLGNEAQMVQQLQTGALDMAFLTVAEISNRVPDFGSLYAPFLVDDIDQAAALLRSSTAEEMLQQLPAQAGIVGLGYGMAGLRQMMARQPINSPSDLSGQKIRITPFDALRDFYIALGTAPTPMPLPAVYDALANGQIDAIDMDFESILIFKFYERANNMLISNHTMWPMVGVVSGRVWRDLSAEDRELIETSMRKHLDNVINFYQEQERAQEEELKSLNINVTYANKDDFAAAVQRWEEIWVPKSPSLPALREKAAELRSNQ